MTENDKILKELAAKFVDKDTIYKVKAKLDRLAVYEEKRKLVSVTMEIGTFEKFYEWEKKQ